MKVVYVLGAGFSVEAGAPTQLNILPEAMKLFKCYPERFDRNKFDLFKSFLHEQLGFTEDNIDSIDLEDIFTPLDRCVSDNSQFRGVSLEKIMNLRESIFYVVGRTIQLMLDDVTKDKKYIDEFARYLVYCSSIRKDRNYRDVDPVSVIREVILQINGAHYNRTDAYVAAANVRYTLSLNATILT